MIKVFYYITYEGAVDIEKVYDPRERRSIEDQINEFGQTPHQLFTKPHVKRFSNSSPTPSYIRTSNPSLSNSGKAISSTEDLPEVESLQLSFDDPAPIHSQTKSRAPSSLTFPNIPSFKLEYTYNLHRE